MVLVCSFGKKSLETLNQLTDFPSTKKTDFSFQLVLSVIFFILKKPFASDVYII